MPFFDSECFELIIMWSRATNAIATVIQKIEIARKPLRSGLFGGHCGCCTNSNMGQDTPKLRPTKDNSVLLVSGKNDWRLSAQNRCNRILRAMANWRIWTVGLQSRAVLGCPMFTMEKTVRVFNEKERTSAWGGAVMAHTPRKASALPDDCDRSWPFLAPS